MPHPDDRPRWAEMTCPCCGGRKRYRVPRLDLPASDDPVPLSRLASCVTATGIGLTLLLVVIARALGLRL